MKYSVAYSLLSGFAAAIPTPTEDGPLNLRAVEKRATITDAANIGFASLNGGTKGGAGGSTTTVSTLPQLTAAAAVEAPIVIVVAGNINGAAKIRLTSDTTVVGKAGSSLTGVGFYVRRVKNVIIRNMKIGKVLASNGDAIGIDGSTNVWVDSNDLSGDFSAGKDTYDGLTDVSHAADFVTISNNFFHNHHKGVLIGHSDKNSAQDVGHLRVTLANNYWSNIGSRTPSVRFGTAHIVNSFYENVSVSGINSRMGAQLLVESTTFTGSKQAITFLDSPTTGYVVAKDVDLGGSTNTAPAGTLQSVPYTYSLLGSAKVKASVTTSAGQKLNF